MSLTADMEQSLRSRGWVVRMLDGCKTYRDPVTGRHRTLEDALHIQLKRERQGQGNTAMPVAQRRAEKEMLGSMLAMKGVE